MIRVAFFVMFAFTAFVLGSSPAEAAKRHGHKVRSDHHYGLVCGLTQRLHFGITNTRYNLARAWLDFPRTTAHPDAVVVQARAGKDSAGKPGGHVSRIVRNTGHCTAVVADEKGTYERNICANLLAYVQPRGGAVTAFASPSKE